MSDSKWTAKDKLKLEAEIVLALKPRLDLDPSPEVVQIANRNQYNAKKLNNRALKRFAFELYSETKFSYCLITQN